MPYNLSKITEPTLLLDLDKVRRNITRMQLKADAGVVFRPHFKTHQCAAVGEIFRQKGIEKITVSSLQMAEYFARHGWNDITLSFAVNLRQSTGIDKLAAKIQLNLLVENRRAVQHLAANLTSRTKVFIKIDTGYQRTGCHWENETEIFQLVNAVRESKQLQFAGLLAHAGHTYTAKSKEQILQIYQDTVGKMQQLQAGISERFGIRCVISIGDTPSCSLVTSFNGVDEIRPGNFVFYDAMQLQLGSCRAEEIALVLACPVVAKYETRQQIVIHGGAVHLSKESIPFKKKGRYYGLIVPLKRKTGWGNIFANSHVSSLSQEHGIIRADEALFKSIEIGDLLGIVPVHSCLTVNLMRKYLTSEGSIFKALQL